METENKTAYKNFLRQQQEIVKNHPKGKEFPQSPWMPCAGISTLKKRGWTEKMVKEMLGEPYKMANNPHWASGPKRRLWLISKVLEAEDRMLKND